MCTPSRASPYDFYPTPAWCVHRILERLDLPGGDWLEPGAGDGAIIRAVAQSTFSRRGEVRWTAVERRTEVLPELHRSSASCEVIHGDYLEDPAVADRLAGRRFAVAFGNPPLTRAADFIKATLTRADTVVMLLRHNFLATQRRHSFVSTHVPDVYVLPDRPSFEKGKTDNATYAWMVWRNGGRRTEGSTSVLALTLPSERRLKAGRRLKLAA